MPKWRVLFIHALIALLIAGSFFDIITGREHWPFSPYAMYASARRERSLSAVWLFGVTQEAPNREVPLNAFRYIQPFHHNRLSRAFERMDPRARRAALTDCLIRYEALRSAGRHDGPALKGLRLYQLEWELDPWARNLHNPSERRLIAEVERSAGDL